MSKSFFVSATIWRDDGFTKEPEEVIEAEEVAAFDDLAGAVQFVSDLINLGQPTKVSNELRPSVGQVQPGD